MTGCFENESYLDHVSLQPSDLQDLLMCESFFDEFTTSSGHQNDDSSSSSSMTADSPPVKPAQLPTLAATGDNVVSPAQLFFGYQRDSMYGDKDNAAKGYHMTREDVHPETPSASFSTTPLSTTTDSLLSSPNDIMAALSSPEMHGSAAFPIHDGKPIYNQAMFDNFLSGLVMLGAQQPDRKDPGMINALNTEANGQTDADARNTKRRRNNEDATGKSRKQRQPTQPTRETKQTRDQPAKPSDSGPLVDESMAKGSYFAPAIKIPNSEDLSSPVTPFSAPAPANLPNGEPFLKALMLLNNDQWGDSGLLNMDTMSTSACEQQHYHRSVTPPPSMTANHSVPSEPSPGPEPEPLEMKKQKKVAHNAIERRYRNNINDRIADLKNVVPALCHLRSKHDSEEEIDGVVAATKLNKATILRKATEYIIYLKRSNEELRGENSTLRAMVKLLPGGGDLLQRFMLEKEKEKQQATGTKRKGRDRSMSSSESSDRDSLSPPPPSRGRGRKSGKALMGVFLSVSLFYSPYNVFGGREHRHYHPEEKTLGGVPLGTGGASAWFNLSWIWWAVRTAILFACLVYFSRTDGNIADTRARRVNSDRNRQHSMVTSVSESRTPQQVYRTLSESMHALPTGGWRLVFGVVAEALRFIVRRLICVDIAPWETELDETAAVARWLHMGEAECCGGNPRASRLSILYSALRTLNLAELAETEEYSSDSSLARVYVTAAIQFAIALPKGMMGSRAIPKYFWELAVRTAQTEQDESVGGRWLQHALAVSEQRDEEDEEVSTDGCGSVNMERMRETMVTSAVWRDALITLNHAVRLGRDAAGPKKKLGFSEPSSVFNLQAVPLALLSNLQALHHLRVAYVHLMSLISSPLTNSANKKRDPVSSSYDEPVISRVVARADPATPAYWYALVAAAVEAYYFGSVELGDAIVVKLKEVEPRHHPHCHQHILEEEESGCLGEDPEGLACTYSDMTKKIIAFTLVGTALLKRGKVQEAVRVLSKSRAVAEQRREVDAKLALVRAIESVEDEEDEEEEKDEEVETSPFCRAGGRKSYYIDPVARLEREIETLADFLVGLCGVESWIDVWRVTESCPIATQPPTHTMKGRDFADILSAYILYLRRLVSRPPLMSHGVVGEVLERLCRMNRIIKEAGGDGADSGCECCDDEPSDHEQEKVKSVERAWRILKGVC
ncbi:uncharacterized protein VTP21DRAFT_3602 [Calcarisporiella thermophila]|uniref:uncharacterized protein n=1 Tax=Calcarisporiella thermophila TaxID=911321 RepID=UPI00374337E5